jgi:hypothetical protein
MYNNIDKILVDLQEEFESDSNITRTTFPRFCVAEYDYIDYKVCEDIIRQLKNKVKLISADKATVILHTKRVHRQGNHLNNEDEWLDLYCVYIVWTGELPDSW